MIKTIVRKQLIRICGGDFPRQMILYMRAGGKRHGLLRHTNVILNKTSLSGDRRLRGVVSEDGAVEASSLDLYGKEMARREQSAGRTRKDKISLYQWLQRDAKPGKPVAPLISGAHLWYSNPPSIEYCESMFTLHLPWTSRNALPKGDRAREAFKSWHRTGVHEGVPFPRYLQIEIAKHSGGPSASHYEDDATAQFDFDGAADNETLDLVGAKSCEAEDLVGLKFKHDNFSMRIDFDQRRHTLLQHSACSDYADERSTAALRDPLSWWELRVEDEKKRRATAVSLGLTSDNPWHPNMQQRLPILLLLLSLYAKFNTLTHRLPADLHAQLMALPLKGKPLGRRVLLIGKPGAGKTYCSRCCVTLSRMVVGTRMAAVVGAPTGIAGFNGNGSTWHSLLGIPAGRNFTRDFSHQGSTAEKQKALDGLFAAFGEETSQTGRTLFGWVAHRFRLNVAHGAGHDDPDAGEHLPFWMQSGDVRRSRLHLACIAPPTIEHTPTPHLHSLGPSTVLSARPRARHFPAQRRDAQPKLQLWATGLLALHAGRDRSRSCRAPGCIAAPATASDSMHAQWRLDRSVRSRVHELT